MSRARPPSLWRTTVLPSEHGSWAFVLEPPIFGLMWGPSWAGCAATLAVLLGFVAYRPLRLGLRDLRLRKTYPRTRFGLAVGAVCLGLAVASVGVAVRLGGPGLIEPLAATGLLAGLFCVVDAAVRPGHLGRELLGALVTTPLAAIGLLARGPTLGDWLWVGLAGGAVVAAKAWGAILYVRMRLKGTDAPRAGRVAAWGTALAGLALGAAWSRPGEPPVLAAGYALLLVRAAYGLSPLAKVRPPKHVGFQELGYSLAFYATAAIAFARHPTFGPA
ncbi:MAG: YwiC-like family protein [Fimbriimonadaceae bacterium]|nr:YwiC-like family protein [Fimbriimonadaceae bacterium]